MGSPFLLLHCLQIHCRDDLVGILRGITHSITHYQFIWSIYKLKRFLGLIGLLWPPVRSISYLGRGSEPDNGGWEIWGQKSKQHPLSGYFKDLFTNNSLKDIIPALSVLYGGMADVGQKAFQKGWTGF